MIKVWVLGFRSVCLIERTVDDVSLGIRYLATSILFIVSHFHLNTQLSLNKMRMATMHWLWTSFYIN